MTTDVIKKIGASNSPVAMDYSTVSAWAAAIPDVVALDQQWIGEVYNQGVMTLSGKVALTAISGNTTHRIILRAATGASFKDHASVATNPLRYNNTLGAAIEGNYNYQELINQTGPGWFEISGLQFNKSGSQPGIASGDSSVVGFYCHDCIVQCNNGNTVVGSFATATSATNRVQNCLLISTGAGIGVQFGSVGSVINNTIVNISGSAINAGIQSNYAAADCYNNAIFGYGTPINPHAGSTSSGTNNVTDSANYTGSGGPTGIAGAAFTTANFNALSGVTTGAGTGYDYRIPTGSVLKDAASNANAPAKDIVGTTRPQGTTSDVGAWEFPAAIVADDFMFHATL